MMVGTDWKWMICFGGRRLRLAVVAVFVSGWLTGGSLPAAENPAGSDTAGNEVSGGDAAGGDAAAVEASWDGTELALVWRGRGRRRLRETGTWSEVSGLASDSAAAEGESEGEPVEEPASDSRSNEVSRAERPNSEDGLAEGAGTATNPSTDPAKVETANNTADNAAGTGEGERVTVLKPILTHSVAMTEIHNEHRAQSGLPAQQVDEDLSRVAQEWAEHMASVGSMYHGSGEQIIAYSGGDRSYSAGFRTWLGSPPHRAWLCSRGDLCGFGYAVGRNGCAYYAGAFGSTRIFREASAESSDVTWTASSGGRRQARRTRR